MISLRSTGEKEAYDSRILGSGDFVQAIMEETEERLKRQLPERKKAGLVSKAIKRRCKEAGIEEKAK